MKRMTKTVASAFLLSGLLFTTACSEETKTEEPNVNTKNTTVKGVIESESQFSLMNEAIEESNNQSFFSNSSANITLFAANNDAFNKLFADFSVSSMSELETKVGEEAFSDLILYHAINGNFNLSAFNDGFVKTNANNEEGDDKLDVLIETTSSSSIKLNGGDNNGASNVGSSSFAATNGSVIEIGAVLMSQTNFENVEEGESENTLFLSLVADADASVRTMLDDRDNDNTVLVMNDAQIETLLSVRLRGVLDRDDFENLLDANAQATLFTELGVSTLDDLIANVTLSSILNLQGMSLTTIFAEMESDDKAELVNTLIINGDFDADDMISTGKITTEAGLDFDVTSNTNGDLVLTDEDGNTILLGGSSTTSANGSIFVINSIEEK